MLLPRYAPLGSGGPEGHFLAAALPYGLLCWQLLGAMDSELRTEPAPPGPQAAPAGEGRQGLGAGRDHKAQAWPWPPP